MTGKDVTDSRQARVFISYARDEPSNGATIRDALSRAGLTGAEFAARLDIAAADTRFRTLLQDADAASRSDATHCRRSAGDEFSTSWEACVWARAWEFAYTSEAVILIGDDRRVGVGALIASRFERHARGLVAGNDELQSELKSLLQMSRLDWFQNRPGLEREYVVRDGLCASEYFRRNLPQAASLQVIPLPGVSRPRGCEATWAGFAARFNDGIEFHRNRNRQIEGGRENVDRFSLSADQAGADQVKCSYLQDTIRKTNKFKINRIAGAAGFAEALVLVLRRRLFGHPKSVARDLTEKDGAGGRS
jgi:hypothetical protein